jgi:riboflavin transporter FmnP
MTNSSTKKLTTLAMLCAMAYTIAATATMFPGVIEFLRFDPKDVVLLFGGFIYGPLAALMMAVVVALLEMITISPEGYWGCLMNVISSASFVCTASFIYHRRKTLGGAITGLIVGVLLMTAMMTLWNWLVVPEYKGWPRAVVADMLIPVFIPFNLFKGGLNAVLTMMLFKPVTTALVKLDLIEPAIIGTRSAKMKWVFIVVGLAAVTAILIWARA